MLTQNLDLCNIFILQVCHLASYVAFHNYLKWNQVRNITMRYNAEKLLPINVNRQIQKNYTRKYTRNNIEWICNYEL